MIEGEHAWAVAGGIALLTAWRPRTFGVLAALLAGDDLAAIAAACAGMVAGRGARFTALARRGRRTRSVAAVRGGGGSSGDSLVIGRGESARTLEHWRDLLRSRPVRTALTGMCVLREGDGAAEAAGAVGPAAGAFVRATAVCSVAWTGVLMLVVMLIRERTYEPLARLGAAGALTGYVLTASFIGVWLALHTREGRRRAAASLRRAVRHEFWPAWVFYLPLAPYIAWLAMRHGGARVVTCCNPAIANGGGVVGESKAAILEGLARAGAGRRVLPAARIEAGPSPDARASAALSEIAARPELGGMPVILKPDSGQRGFAVRLARSEEDVRAYFREMHAPALVQAYHAGPEECGVLWVRCTAGARGGRDGFVFSITRKVFPRVTGDGRSPVEELVWRHPRYRCQAGVFLERHAARRRWVPREGEVLRLAESGNHCQGTMFADGAAMITAGLEGWIDGTARAYAGEDDAPGGLDFGRFDIRYASAAGLERGDDVGIVELNGTMSESTNLYDPDRSVVWAYGVLFRQWGRMYELGAARQGAGVRPLSWAEIARQLRDHLRGRSGSAIAD